MSHRSSLSLSLSHTHTHTFTSLVSVARSASCLVAIALHWESTSGVECCSVRSIVAQRGVECCTMPPHSPLSLTTPLIVQHKREACTVPLQFPPRGAQTRLAVQCSPRALGSIRRCSALPPLSAVTGRPWPLSDRLVGHLSARRMHCAAPPSYSRMQQGEGRGERESKRLHTN